MKIFISYNSSVEQVNQFAKDLKTKLLQDDGIDQAFIFQDIGDNPTGRIWSKNLARAIKDCDIFIAIITEKYLNSDICHREISYARDTFRKPVFPIIFKDRKPNYDKGDYALAIQMIVQQVNYITFETTNVDSPKYGDLLTSIKQKAVGARCGNDETDNRSVPNNQSTCSYIKWAIIFLVFAIATGIVMYLINQGPTHKISSSTVTMPSSYSTSLFNSTIAITSPNVPLSSSTSKGVPLSSSPCNSRPKSSRELAIALKDLVHWELFGIHIGIKRQEIEIINRECRNDGVSNCKIKLYGNWLDSDTNATWQKVIDALKQMKLNTMARDIEKIYC